MTITNTPQAQNDSEKVRLQQRRLVFELKQALPERVDQLDLIFEVTGRGYGDPDETGHPWYPSLEEYRRIVEAAPEYIARQAAERAASTPAPSLTPAADRLAAVEQSIRDGACVTAETFALARAQADAESDLARLAELGATARAKAETEAERVREAAKQEVRDHPPVMPAGIEEAAAKAKAAVDDVAALVVDHRRQVNAARAVLRDAGVPPALYGRPSDEDPAFDGLFHGHEHQQYLVIDGETVSADPSIAVLRSVAVHAQRKLAAA